MKANENCKRCKYGGAYTTKWVNFGCSHPSLFQCVSVCLCAYCVRAPNSLHNKFIRANDEYLHNISIRWSTFHIHSGRFSVQFMARHSHCVAAAAIPAAQKILKRIKARKRRIVCVCVCGSVDSDGGQRRIRKCWHFSFSLSHLLSLKGRSRS